MTILSCEIGGPQRDIYIAAHGGEVIYYTCSPTCIYIAVHGGEVVYYTCSPTCTWR